MEGRLRSRIELQLAKARRKLASAKAIFKEGLYDDTISRAYYAMFHAAKALLQLENLEAKTHSGVITLLNQHFIKEKRLDVRFGKILAYAKELREGGDYDIVFEASKEDAEGVLEDAMIFVKEIEHILANS